MGLVCVEWVLVLLVLKDGEPVNQKPGVGGVFVLLHPGRTSGTEKSPASALLCEESCVS